RLACPGGGSGLGGLTRSLEGGFDDVEESFRAAASCACTCSKAACSSATLAVNASTCSRSSAQFAQGVALSPMLPYSIPSRIGGHTVNRHRTRLSAPRRQRSTSRASGEG